MPKVSIPQKQMTIDVEMGANLMNALLEAGLPVASSCHGDGICSMCRMRISVNHTISGTPSPNLNEVINAPADFEINTLKRNKCAEDERLSCQIEVRGDITVQTKYW